MICRAAYEKKADNIVIMQMKDKTSLCDFFVIMSATSNVRVRTIADSVESDLEEKGYRTNHKEGYKDGVWVLMDYSEVIVHIFSDGTRQFYDLENLWGDAIKRNYIE